MELTLAVVSCGLELEVALGGNPMAGVSLVRLAGRSPRSTLLLAAADLLVEDAGTERDSIRRIAVTRGPGSFTGIRSGLATAHGIAAALSAEILAFDSLTAQAARTDDGETVWAAQPGRRGEVYARHFSISQGGPPQPRTAVEVLCHAEMASRGPWMLPIGLSIRGLEAALPRRSAAEALLVLAAQGCASEPVEPQYIEAPPIHSPDAPA